ncbi:MAG: DNA gyrase/topoisomerase IV subunit A, partial [Duncaniella sp.]|nr:DNA gyrase/topoisomerase IV subunit A [Duncaniella sp.]
KVWFDHDVLRLNYDGRGEYLGEFGGNDLVIVILNNGEYYTSSFDAANHYEDTILRIEKFAPHKVWTAILDDADQKYPYIKRFTFEPTAKAQRYLGDNEKSSLLLLSDEPGLHVEVVFGGADSFRPAMEIVARDFIAVKSVKAKGKRLTTFAIDHITELEPIATEEILDEDDSESGQSSESTDPAPEAVAEPEKSDDEVRDELTGQHRLF